MRGRRKAERRVSGRVLYVGAEGLRLPVWKLSSHPLIHVSSGAWELLSSFVGEAGTETHCCKAWKSMLTPGSKQGVYCEDRELLLEPSRGKSENQGNGWAAAEQGPRNRLSRPGSQL